jgi:hypothetical protein
MLKSKGVPPRYWGEAVSTVVYLLNRSPTKSVEGRTPYEAWCGRKPHVGHLRTFGCIAHVKKTGPGIGKLSDRSSKMVLLGYEPGTKGYRLVDPTTEKLHISRDVVFEEHEAWDWNNQSRVQLSKTEGFTVDFQYTVPCLGTDFSADAGSGNSGGENLPLQSPQSSTTSMVPHVQPSPGFVTPQAQSSATPVTPTTPHVVSVSSPSGNSDGVPVRYRTLTDLFDAERITMPKRGGELGFSKIQQQLNPKQEPNFTPTTSNKGILLEIQQC